MHNDYVLNGAGIFDKKDWSRRMYWLNEPNLLTDNLLTKLRSLTFWNRLLPLVSPYICSVQPNYLLYVSRKEWNLYSHLSERSTHFNQMRVMRLYQHGSNVVLPTLIFEGILLTRCYWASKFDLRGRPWRSVYLVRTKIRFPSLRSTERI